MVAAISTEGFSEIFGGVQRRIGLDVLVCFFVFPQDPFHPKRNGTDSTTHFFSKFLVVP